jgi:hypothetical protein
MSPARLVTLRRGRHGIDREKIHRSRCGSADIVRLYERGALQQVR